MFNRIQDYVLSFLQKRCTHPAEISAVDVLEGCGGDAEVAYCNRCGAIAINYGGQYAEPRYWRRPDPNLLRGM